VNNPNLTEIICIIDRSGSMHGIAADAIGGFNTFLEDQKKDPSDKCLMTFVQFDDVYEIIHSGKPIQDVPPITRETYVPRGSTALLDAIGRTVNDVGARLSRTPEAERPGAVVVVILTDGEENASKEFNQQQIFDMITKQRESFQWEFVFLAANQDAIKAGAQYGIQNAVAFAATGAGVQQVYGNVSRGVSSFRSTKHSADLKVDDAPGDSSGGGASGSVKH